MEQAQIRLIVDDGIKLALREMDQRIAGILSANAAKGMLRSGVTIQQTVDAVATTTIKSALILCESVKRINSTPEALIYPEISQGSKFSFGPSSFLPNKTVFSLFTDCSALLALLNSRLTWFYLSQICTALRGGEWRLLLQSIYVETLPIPFSNYTQKADLGRLADCLQKATEKRHDLQQAITRRIPDLAADPANAKLTGKLKEWWTLPDFAAFKKEVEKALKVRIPLQERNEWENWITASRTQIHSLSAEITQAEAEINAKVYALFDLTPDEIALLEASI